MAWSFDVYIEGGKRLSFLDGMQHGINRTVAACPAQRGHKRGDTDRTNTAVISREVQAAETNPHHTVPAHVKRAPHQAAG